MASEVDDLILLSKIDEENILNTLKNRLNKDIIYTLIGNVVISVNPYKNMESLYTNKVVESYKNKNIYEISPHIFALADNAFRDMKNLMKDQCVIISGESGAGKTEASKIFMKYITSVASNEETEGNKSIIQAKEQLLNSNPCLEAFGNSKTMRNDNSSRFGKYMDLQFDFNGIPTGGKITTYLLEKSRVVHITEGERTFHIFYQLLKGASDEHLKSLYLTREVKSYQYLSSSNCEKIEHVDDAKDFEVTLKSFNLIGIKNDKIFEIFDLIAAILHLGNINFKEDENGAAVIDDTTPLKHVSTLLGVTEMDLLLALTNSSIKDKKKESEQKKITVPLNAKKAILARDALSKQIYEKIFNYLVKLINSKLSKKRNSIVQASCNVIGVLDIYGFEIMNINSFEQFVINYCNEKLQQLFIELVLRSEQEEYAKEGIGWEEIKFFNNKTICDLIESKNIGIIALLDEECVMPGNPTDQTFLQKLNQSNFSAKHLHFNSYSKSPKSKLNLNCFRLRHYAGDVDYTVDGFIKKNKDKFNLDLIQVLKKSSNQLIKKIFEEDIREFGDEAPASNSSNNNNFGGNNKNMNNAGKKGESLATQFKSSMHQLMQNLSSKSPHYIRCIKSNALKAPDEFDSELVLHQIRYLGLQENIRVRCAGFCYRQSFEKFIQRFKMLSNSTWPHPKSTSWVTEVKYILDDCGVNKSEYQIGRSKIFIRAPRTVHEMEAKRNQKKHVLSTKIRALWVAYLARKKYKRMYSLIVKLQSNLKRYQAQKRFQKIQWAVTTFSKNFKRKVQLTAYSKILFKVPKHAAAYIQTRYKRFKFKIFLKLLAETVNTNTKNWSKIEWPIITVSFINQIYPILKVSYSRMMAKKYRLSLTSEKKLYLMWKATAHDLFFTKESYSPSFISVYQKVQVSLSADQKQKLEKLSIFEDKIESMIECSKLHRHSLNKDKPCYLALTKDKVTLISHEKNLDIKVQIELKNIAGISCSTLSDGIFVLHTPWEKKGDLILRSDPNCIEFLSALYNCMKNLGKIPTVQVNSKIDFLLSQKTNYLQFSTIEGDKFSMKHSSNTWIANIPKIQIKNEKR